GFNQAEVLARELARRVGRPCAPAALVRRKDTAPQAASPRPRGGATSPAPSRSAATPRCPGGWWRWWTTCSPRGPPPTPAPAPCSRRGCPRCGCWRWPACHENQEDILTERIDRVFATLLFGAVGLPVLASSAAGFGP